MKRSAAFVVFCFFFLLSHAQRVQTIVPKQVVAGNAFQIQYIITDPYTLENISAPQLENLRLISGPNYYKGNSLVNGKMQSIENIAYTVVPLQAGTIKINAVIVRFKDGDEKTKAISLTAVPQPKASFNTVSTYTDLNLYAPSSKTDLDKLVDKNLFIKTEVDKRICFMGEAITVTFKLYSRLQSTSEVVNAPSLYGFSVMDVLDINEAHQSVETINGKVFNTSVLRKLQLYPAQTGKLLIDPMQMQNEIEFKDSVKGGKIKIEKMLASNPVEITVKPLPSKRPVDFAGAVGSFAISTNLQQQTIRTNQQGKLLVTISGKGNFIQFAPPDIDWPKGIDSFDPLITEELNKNQIPVEGKRTYVYNFTVDQPGSFVIPSIHFSFFDPAAGDYKTMHTDSLRMDVLPAVENKISVQEEKKNYFGNTSLWFFTFLSVILIAAIILFSRKKGKKVNQQVPVAKPTYMQRFHAIVSSSLSDKEICSEIVKLLAEVKKEHSLSQGQEQELQSIQNDCRLLIYSDVAVENKEELQKRMERLLLQLSD